MINFSSISPHVGISYADTSKKCEILDDVFNRYLKIIHSNAHSNKLKFSSKSIPQVETILVQVYNCENYPSDKMNEAYVIRIGWERSNQLITRKILLTNHKKTILAHFGTMNSILVKVN